MWHFVVLDINGVPQGELTIATARKMQFFLDAPCTMGFDMAGVHPQTLMVKEMQTDVLAYRDARPVFRGRVGASSDTLDTVHKTTFGAIDYRGVLARRNFDSAVAFAGADQKILAEYAITSNGTYTRGVWPSAVVLRDLSIQGGDNAASVVDKLARLSNGFEWEIDPLLNYNFYYPFRGQNLGQALVYGDNVLKVRRTFDPSTLANRIRYTGATSLPNAKFAADFPSQALFGEWDKQLGDTSIVDDALLQATADGALAASSAFNPAWEMTLKSGWWDPGLLWLGDTVETVVMSGRIQFDQLLRVSKITVDLSDDGGVETVVVSVGADPDSLWINLIDIQKRLTGVERTR